MNLRIFFFFVINNNIFIKVTIEVEDILLTFDTIINFDYISYVICNLFKKSYFLIIVNLKKILIFDDFYFIILIIVHKNSQNDNIDLDFGHKDIIHMIGFDFDNDIDYSTVSVVRDVFLVLEINFLNYIEVLILFNYDVNVIYFFNVYIELVRVVVHVNIDHVNDVTVLEVYIFLVVDIHNVRIILITIQNDFIFVNNYYTTIIFVNTHFFLKDDFINKHSNLVSDFLIVV